MLFESKEQKPKVAEGSSEDIIHDSTTTLHPLCKSADLKKRMMQKSRVMVRAKYFQQQVSTWMLMTLPRHV
jgi:hypothetical protein